MLAAPDKDNWKRKRLDGKGKVLWASCLGYRRRSEMRDSRRKAGDERSAAKGRVILGRATQKKGGLVGRGARLRA